MTLPSLNPDCITFALIVSIGTISFPLTIIPEIGTPSLTSADDAYADWDNLTRAETKAKIAISVNGNNISTADSASPVALGDVASAYGEDEFGAFQADPQTLDLEGSALYGKAWDNSEDMLYKYDTVIEFAMK